MTNVRTVQNCRWAEPTLFSRYPVWMGSDDYPWTCYSTGLPKPVEDTTVCVVCKRWEGRVTRDAASPPDPA